MRCRHILDVRSVSSLLTDMINCHRREKIRFPSKIPNNSKWILILIVSAPGLCIHFTLYESPIGMLTL